MPKYIEKYKSKQDLQIDPDIQTKFESWLFNEIEDAINLRGRFDNLCKECLKMYEGVPKLETRDIPIENAPNIEVTIGAISVDMIYAQAIDLLFNTSPFVTVRPIPKKSNDVDMCRKAKALQRFVNHIAEDKDAGLRDAVDTSVLGDIKLGTGLIYIPWVERVKKTKSSKVLSRGPKFYSIPLEDLIVPLGADSNIEELPWVGVRFYKTLNELNALVKSSGFDIDKIQPIDMKSSVRQVRETLGKSSDTPQRQNQLYDTIYIPCFYDIDGDGIDEDLLVIWNHSGRKAMKIMYNPYDRRPITKMVYQLREHMFFGLGVLQMLMPYEDELSDIHNYTTLNMLLANSRVWVGGANLPETLKIWPSRVIPDAEDLKPLQMADVYNSAWQAQMMTMQLANQRVGVNDVSRGSSIPSRTPGITAMSFLQQVNKRFVPAFDSMKICVNNALSQALYRYQEKLLAGDIKVEESIISILGTEDGIDVIMLLKDEKFDESVTVELNAASASVNREADRQNAIMLTQLLGQYYQKTLELVSVASNPQTPPEVRSVTMKIIAGASEIIDKTIRTFDQVRDPGQFIIDVSSELNSIEMAQGEQAALTQLLGLIGQGQEQIGTVETPQIGPPEGVY